MLAAIAHGIHVAATSAGSGDSGRLDPAVQAQAMEGL